MLPYKHDIVILAFAGMTMLLLELLGKPSFGVVEETLHGLKDG